MRFLIVVYAGTMALLSSAGIPAFSASSGFNALRSDGASSTHSVTPETDLPNGKAGFSEADADMPVRQGKLEEVEEGRVLNATVYSTDGEEIGKVEQVLKDTRTGETEYIVFVRKESKL